MKAVGIVGQTAGLLVGMISTMALVIAICVVQGYTVPPQAYLFLASRVPSSAIDSDARELGPPLGYPTPPDKARDIAFEWYNIRADARVWLSELPIAYAAMPVWGTYDPNTHDIRVSNPYLPIFLHEYAHANFDRKPIIEKLGFAVALLHLYIDGDDRAQQAKAIVAAELSTAVRQARLGDSYNPILESYARLAEVSQGDLRVLPEILQAYYADYLQPGPNHSTAAYGQTATATGYP